MRQRREWIADAMIGAVLAAPVVANHLLSDNLAGGLAGAAAIAAAVLLSRRAPLASWLIVVLGSIYDGNFAFAIPVMSYLVGLRTDRIRPVALTFGVTAAAGTVLNLAVLRTGPAQWFMMAMMLLLIGVFPWLVGRHLAQRSRLISAGWERAARLEYERRMVVRQARLRERARIAQEMHDSLGHELSLIALGAGALETTPGLPEPQQATAARIRESAATATDRLREIIGVLRDEDDRAPLEPADEPVEALVTRARQAGMAVTLRQAHATPAPVPAGRTVYHVVREALTNARLHAPGAPVTVEIEHREDVTAVAVVNEAAASGPPLGDSTGLGLVGLRERVRLAGGVLTAGATARGGFRTAAEVPHRPPPEAVAGPTGAVAMKYADLGAAKDADPGAMTDLDAMTDLGAMTHLGATTDLGATTGAELPSMTALRSARRRANRSLVAALLTPSLLAVVAAIGYYSVAVTGSVLSSATFDRIAAGTPRDDLDLPARQVWQPPTGELPPAPAGSRCEFYTDGNFPMADAAYRLCFAGGRLVTKDRLR